MEYCQLGDLSFFIKKRDTLALNTHTADMVKKYPNPPAGGLNEVVVRHFLQQLASALEFLRNKNLIHRDVKPQNLLIIPSPLYYAKARPEIMPCVPSDSSLVPIAGIESLPMLKLADFGFARSLPSTSLAETLCGSPLYMAPEILRYEKYDAKADLWSVGTVTFELMTGRPPFRASNHVELLRKIERGEDKIKFPEDAVLTDAMKKLIRGLLRRNPVERTGFSDFFDNTVVKDEIPGLVGSDRPKERPDSHARQTESEPMTRQGSGSRNPPDSINDVRTRRDVITPRRSSSQLPTMATDHKMSHQPTDNATRPGLSNQRPTVSTRDATDKVGDATEAPVARRPSAVSYATAPARPASYTGTPRKLAGATMQRQSSRDRPSPSSSAPKDISNGRDRTERHIAEKAAREAKEAEERAAQDVAFERDYVVLDKRAVEVNAMADLLAAEQLSASPGGTQQQRDPHHGAMVRRATTQGTPTSAHGAQGASPRAIQLSTKKRPDHMRQVSYERRLRSATSTSSAISKAINLASGRLFNFGVSPPLGFGKGASPPLYSAFPAYPTTHGSLLMIGDGTKASSPLDEDAKAVRVIEESATRSDVVYGFAEVKYKQLIPVAPSMDHGLGLHEVGIPENDEGAAAAVGDDEGLTVDAVVTLSEEALVLYVKALSLLAHSMDIAGAWWSRKSQEAGADETTSAKSHASVAVGNRVNNVVQWVRNRFNEVLEKAELVRLKLIDAQKRLPLDHPSHPSNHPSSSSTSTSTARMGTSADNVCVTSGVSAEKLMYLRAVEMCRSAAVNELVCEDMAGCEIAYVTAIRMLEAVLESEDEAALPRKRVVRENGLLGHSKSVSDDFNPVNPDDRETVLKSKSENE